MLLGILAAWAVVMGLYYSGLGWVIWLGIAVMWYFIYDLYAN